MIVIAAASFVGVLVAVPVEIGKRKRQFRSRVGAALRTRRTRKQQAQALPAPTVNGSPGEMSGMPAEEVSEDDLERLRQLASRGRVMRSRVPPRETRTSFGFPPRDLVASFESWEAEVSAALCPWPELLTQFQGEPVREFSIGLHPGSGPYWRKIEHRTDVLTAIVKELDQHT